MILSDEQVAELARATPEELLAMRVRVAAMIRETDELLSSPVAILAQPDVIRSGQNMRRRLLAWAAAIDGAAAARQEILDAQAEEGGSDGR